MTRSTRVFVVAIVGGLACTGPASPDPDAALTDGGLLDGSLPDGSVRDDGSLPDGGQFEDGGVPTNCDELARAECAGLFRCAPGLAVLFVGGALRDCEDEERRGCELLSTAPGSTADFAAQLACFVDVHRSGCVASFGPTPASCAYAGTRAEGESCAIGAQCVSGVCSGLPRIAADGLCEPGRCASAAAPGASCDLGRPCSPPSECLAAYDDAAADRGRSGPMTCRSPQQGNAGAGCAVGTDRVCAIDHYCDASYHCVRRLPTGSACTAPTGDAEDPCSLVDAASCAHGTCTAPYRGFGEACTADDYCFAGLCTAGTCPARVYGAAGATCSGPFECEPGLVCADDATPVCAPVPCSPAADARLTPGPPSAFSNFGYAVALDVDATRALVGSDADLATAGSARVFARTGTSWVEEAVLVGSASTVGDSAGHAVALSGDGTRAIVGAPFADPSSGFDAGLAVVFVRSGATWTEETTLVGAAGERVGGAVAISGDGLRAFVQAADASAVGAGTVIVFLRTGATWSIEARLAPTAPTADETFGASIAAGADGSRAIVGSPGAYAMGVSAGVTRVFARSGTSWAEEATLVASGSADYTNFGTSVGLDATASRAVIGSQSAGARVFSRTGTAWSEEATLALAPPRDRDGAAIAISGDGARVLFGAPGHDIAVGSASGTVVVYERAGTTWTESRRLYGLGGGDGFGDAVAWSSDGSYAAVGAPYLGYGDVYIFQP